MRQLLIIILATFCRCSHGGRAYVESEKLLDFVESLPRETLVLLLKDPGLTRFINDYEEAAFSQPTLWINSTDYEDLRAVMRRHLVDADFTRLESIVLLNATEETVPPLEHFSSEEDHHRVYPVCSLEFDDPSSIGRSVGGGATVVEIEHEIVHPILRIYSKKKRGLHRILKHPNLLSGIRSNRNKLFNVLFLDLSLTSILKTEIICYRFVGPRSVLVRTGLLFGKTLDPSELSSIPSYLKHVSNFVKDGEFNSTLLFHFKESNYTSPPLELVGNRPPPCLFFDLLNACRNGGACVGFTGIGHCRCRSGFEGKFCHIASIVVEEIVDDDHSRWFCWVFMSGAVLVFCVVGIIVVRLKNGGGRLTPSRRKRPMPGYPSRSAVPNLDDSTKHRKTTSSFAVPPSITCAARKSRRLRELKSGRALLSDLPPSPVVLVGSRDWSWSTLSQ